MLGAWLRSLRIARQRAVFEIARRWLNWRKIPAETYKPEEIHSILIPLPGDAIGESLMATVFLKIVKTHKPDIEITVASGPKTAPFFVGCDAVDCFIQAGDETMRPRDRMRLLIKEIKRKDRFDLVVDMRTQLKIRLLLFLRQIDARYYLGHAKYDHSLFDFNVPPDVEHTSERWRAAAEIVVGQADGNSKRLSTQDFCLPIDEQKSQIEQWRKTLPPSRANILINLYGSCAHRSFSYSEALNLLRIWIEKFPDDLLQLLPVPGHELEVNRLVAQINSRMVVVAPALPPPPPLSIKTSIALARQADLIFTPDTGMVHIASSLNVPIVAIYENNPENFSEWKPLSDHRAVIFTRSLENSREARVYVHEFNHEDLWTAVNRLLPQQDF